MSEFDGLGKHRNNPACIKSVRVFIILKLDIIRKKNIRPWGLFSIRDGSTGPRPLLQANLTFHPFDPFSMKAR